ncbi:MAG: hypothetical protein K2K82_09405 [Muribaculaceae bacterium]|nr:hypothetical protein [Muribaculaceae bacterium]
MDINEIKQQWNTLKIKMTPAELMKRTTSLEHLMRNYRRFGVLALLCIPGGFSFYQLIQRGAILVSPAVVILFVAAMALSASVDLYLYNQLKEIDLLSMSVTEVADRARNCRRIHLFSQLILLPLVLTFVIIVAVTSTTTFLRWGLLCGALVGMIIGFGKWLEIMRTYRTLT